MSRPDDRPLLRLTFPPRTVVAALLTFGGGFTGIAGSVEAGPMPLLSASFASAAWCAPPALAQAAEDPPEALRLASEAGTLQNGQQFDLAAELWDEFLEKYPQSSLAPKARHYSGVCHMKSGALDKGIARFAEVIEAAKDDPAFALLEDAMLNRGWSEFSLASRTADPTAAATLFRASIDHLAELEKRFPEGRYRDQAAYFSAEARYLSGEAEASVPLYEKVESDFPESPLLPNALYALGVTLHELGRHAEGIAACDRFLTRFPEHSLAGDVAMQRAESQLAVALAAGSSDPQVWSEPLATFARLATDAGFAQADRALYQQAFCEEKLGRTADSAARYASLVETYPTSEYAADSRLSAARVWLAAKEYERGAALLEPHLDAPSAKRGELLHWWAKHRLGQGKPDIVYDGLKSRLGGLGSDPAAARLMLDLADAAFASTAHRSEARDLYAAVVAAHPDSAVAPQALYNAAFEDFEAGRIDAALASVAAFAAAYPNDPFLADMRALEGECRLAKGESQAAADVYAALIASTADHPDRERWPLRLALARFGAKQYAETIAALSAISSWSNPDWQSEAEYLIGAAKFHQGDAAGAITSLTAACDATRGWSQADAAMIVLARAQAKAGRRDEALATLAALPQRFPNSTHAAEAHFRWGEIAEDAGDAAEARRQYALVATAGGPFAPYALVASAWLDQEAGKHAEAEAEFRRALTEFPQHPLAGEATLGLGMALRQLGRHADAIVELDRGATSETDPARRLELRFEAALARLGAEKYEEAERELAALIAENPTWERLDQLMYQHAWAAKYRGDAAAATERFALLAEKFPDSPSAAEGRFHQGEAAYEAQRWTEAQAFYEQALAGKPTVAIADNARYKLGWSRFKQQAWNEARETFETLAASKPAGLLEQTRFMIAECRFEAKEYDQALPAYVDHLAAIESASTVAEPIRQLARLHAAQTANKLKKWDQGLELARGFVAKYAESPATAEAWFEVGEALRGSSKPEEALAAYESAAGTGSPRLAARSRCMIGEILFSQEKYDDAVKQFRRVMFGYDESAPADVRMWQAFAAYEAGRCAQVQIAASQGADRERRIEQAIEAFRYVVERHPQDRLAAEAGKQLEKLQQRPDR